MAPGTPAGFRPGALLPPAAAPLLGAAPLPTRSCRGLPWGTGYSGHLLWGSWPGFQGGGSILLWVQSGAHLGQSRRAGVRSQVGGERDGGGGRRRGGGRREPGSGRACGRDRGAHRWCQGEGRSPSSECSVVGPGWAPPWAGPSTEFPSPGGSWYTTLGTSGFGVPGPPAQLKARSGCQGKSALPPPVHLRPPCWQRAPSRCSLKHGGGRTLLRDSDPLLGQLQAPSVGGGGTPGSPCSSVPHQPVPSSARGGGGGPTGAAADPVGPLGGHSAAGACVQKMAQPPVHRRVAVTGGW